MREIAMGLVGLGGYGGYVCEQLLTLKERGASSLKLTDAFDPTPELFPERVAHLKADGVRIHGTMESLLLADFEAVWLPVPIDLHRSMTEQAVRAGKVVLCEKPAAGCIQDVDAMIARRDAACGGQGIPVAIAFQDMYADSTWQIKRRLIAGEIGTLTDATLWATWPRGEDYFARPWAGRIQRDGVWILDSPANNAMAHFVHLALFFLGDTVLNSARPIRVEAELYRANTIENYDTCCMRVLLEGQSDSPKTLLFALTHAARELHEPEIVITGTLGQLRYSHGQRLATLTRIGGTGSRGEKKIPLIADPHLAVPEGFAAFVRWGGERGAGHVVPHASLEMARSHTLIINGASEAAPVVTLCPPVVMEERPPEKESTEAGGRGFSAGGTLRYIPGIESLMAQAIAHRQMLHETAHAAWTVPPSAADLRGYRVFKGPLPA